MLLCSSPSIADTVGKGHSYTVVSPNGKFIFAMIYPLPPKEDAIGWIDSVEKEIREIRQQYRESGLYKLDGSGTPLWTVDWWAGRVHVSSDGIHLVRLGPWPSSLDEEALSFFANGKLMQTYEISQLISIELLLPHSVSHFQWFEEGHLNDVNLTYEVTTKDKNSFFFDLRSGKIIKQSRPFRNALLSLIGIVCLLGFWLWLRWSDIPVRWKVLRDPLARLKLSYFYIASYVVAANLAMIPLVKGGIGQAIKGAIFFPLSLAYIVHFRGMTIAIILIYGLYILLAALGIVLRSRLFFFLFLALLLFNMSVYAIYMASIIDDL